MGEMQFTGTQEEWEAFVLLNKQNNMVETSIDWFIKEILKHDKSFVEFYGAEIEQAKEKHKDETMDAFQAGKWDWSTHVNHGKNSMDPAEYYNETFK
jgi:hypothetical protein